MDDTSLNIDTCRQIIDNSPDLIFIVQKNKIVFANNAVSETFNIQPGSGSADLDIFKYIHPDYIQLVKTNISERLKGREIPPYELKLIKDGKKEIIVRVHNQMITYNGKPAIMGVLEDISELKRMEEEIKSLSKQTEEFSTITAEILALEDEQDLFDKISSAIVEISDFKRVLISYFKREKPYRDIIGAKGVSEEVLESIKNIEMPKEKYMRYFENAIKLGTQSCYIPHSMKSILDQRAVDYGKERYPEGNRYWHKEDNLLIAIKDSKGEFVGVISVDDSKSGLKPTDKTVRPLEIFANQIAEIISKRKIESQLKRLSEFHKRILENTDVGINTVDLELNITSWNRASQFMTGFKMENVIGKPVTEFIVPANMDKFYLFINKLLNEDRNEEQFIIKRADGESFPVYMICSTMKDDNGLPYGFVQVLQNISIQEKLKSQLQQSEKLAAIGELVSGVAHELNNPLATISGFSEFIKNKEQDEKLRKMANTIFKETHRCARIIENLMSFARQKEIKERSVDIHETLDRALELRQYHLKIGNISINKNYDNNELKTMGDQNQLLQVFLNLINNAYDAMYHYNKKGILTISTSKKSDYIYIEFSDNGPGIDDSIKDKIFLPFFTTKEIGKGTGLGLSTSYGIIKNHKGEIYIDETRKNGANFVIKLPLKFTSTVEISDPVAVKRDGYKYSGRILVIDDEQNILDISSEFLENRGFTVDTVSSGEKALEIIKSYSYDAIIADIKMPGEIDGKKLYSYIKKQIPGSENKIIFITGDIISRETSEFLKDKNNRCILKPFNYNDLEKAVIEVMER